MITLRVVRFAVLTLILLAAFPASASAASCKLSTSEQRRLGATYVTTLSVSRLSCSSGKRQVRAFHRCRNRNGGRDGRCARVDGWRCSERRSGIKTQFSGRVTCKRGSRTVRHTYTQFT